MPNTIGQIKCLTGVGNTGVQPCFLDFKFLQGAILAPKGFEFDTTTLQTTLTAAFYNASKSARLYPIYGFEAPKDDSEKKVVQQMSTGQKHVVREGYSDLSFQFVNGGLSLLQQLRKFNGTNWDFYFLDDDPSGNKLMGIQGSTASKLKAIPSDGGFFWAEPPVFNDGSKISEYMIEFCFKSKYLTDGMQFIVSDFDFPTTLPGLIDVNIVASTTVNATSGSFNVCLVSPTGQDIGALHSAALAAAGIWTGKVHSSQAALTAGSTPTWTASPDGIQPGYFTVKFATTGPYPTPPATIDINLVAPAALAATGTDVESTGALVIASN